MASKPARRLGIDFGRVISGAAVDPSGAEDTSFLDGGVEAALRSPALPGAIEAIRELVKRFEGRVWIVSKAGPTVQRKTLWWLEHQLFWEQTGMTPWSVCFVLERAQKAGVAKQLKLTHFIDDRLDVLEPMRGQVANLYAFGHTEVPDGFIALPDWKDWQRLALIA